MKTCKINSTTYVQWLHGVPNCPCHQWLQPDFFWWQEWSKPDEFHYVTTYTVEAWNEYGGTTPGLFHWL